MTFYIKKVSFVDSAASDELFWHSESGSPFSSIQVVFEKPPANSVCVDKQIVVFT